MKWRNTRNVLTKCAAGKMGCNEASPEANPLPFIQQGDAAHAHRWVQEFTPAAFLWIFHRKWNFHPFLYSILGMPL